MVLDIVKNGGKPLASGMGDATCVTVPNAVNPITHSPQVCRCDKNHPQVGGFSDGFYPMIGLVWQQVPRFKAQISLTTCPKDGLDAEGLIKTLAWDRGNAAAGAKTLGFSLHYRF